jgi:NTP pyrophosphatase (non-canonical NTP hydrolase)
MADYREVLFDVSSEVATAASKWPLMNSAHEAYAILAEEVDELWDHVKTNQKRRDLKAMRKEAIQVAAMAVRFAAEVCTEERGRK